MTDPEHAKGILFGCENQELFLVSADHAGACYCSWKERYFYQHVGVHFNHSCNLKNHKSSDRHKTLSSQLGQWQYLQVLHPRRTILTRRNTVTATLNARSEYLCQLIQHKVENSQWSLASLIFSDKRHVILRYITCKGMACVTTVTIHGDQGGHTSISLLTSHKKWPLLL